MSRTSYSERDSNLRQLGFSSYKEYLESKLWLRIKFTILKQNPICGLCKEKPAVTVHHRCYSIGTLLGKKKRLKPYYLVSVCGSCHCSIEVDSNGNKVDNRDVEKECRAKIKSSKHKKPDPKSVRRAKGRQIGLRYKSQAAARCRRRGR